MEKKFEELIVSYVDNYMQNAEIKSRWKKPLVAFAAADDPLFIKLKAFSNSK